MSEGDHASGGEKRELRSHLIEIFSKERQTPPDCSIVVPVYNGMRFLAESMPSILGQEGVVCDIVISDDRSSDGSLERILEFVKPYAGPHSIRVFQTSHPAPNEHVPLLVTVCRTDRIIQAHQDDISDPDRAMKLSAALTGNVKLVTSVARIRNERGVSAPNAAALADLRKKETFTAYLMSGQGVMGGARYGMHRDIFDKFPLLTVDHLTSGQDVLFPIRAHIIGRFKVIYSPLLTVGDHPDRAGYALFDRQSQVTNQFDFALRRLVIIDVALKELASAKAAGLVAEKRARNIAQRLREARKSFVETLITNREQAIRDGFWLKWVKWRVRSEEGA